MIQHTIQQPDPPPQPAATMPIAAARELAKKLFNIINELSNVMEEETPILLARDYSKQELYLRRKQELTMDYQSTMKVFIENKVLLESLPKEESLQLRSSGKKLEEVTQKNADALRFAHHANEHFLKYIINDIRKDLHKESGYSVRGVLALAEAQRSRPVSVNQRI
ncbi:MAG: hypothetical protein SFW65_06510 [Alphaproteobacteria bacterium]|nr:hypothetical protein [Alphaproteobacteria bacterium]